MVDTPLRKVSVYGVGNFGYAILKHLDRKRSEGFAVAAYDRNEELIRHLNRERCHLYFHKSVKLSNYIDFVPTRQELLAGCDILILAVSSDATREILQHIKPHIDRPLVIVNTAKALDYQTGKRLSEIVHEELRGLDYTYALLAGGTIASDLFQHEPLGVDIACTDTKTLAALEQLFTSDNLHVYTTTDLKGVEYAAAFKNIIAILAGIVKGLGFSYGAETHVISRTAHLLAEACIEHLGASPETFSMGRQSWGNDLWMSCTGNTRNRELGILLGKGTPVDEALGSMAAAHKTVEGVNTIRILNKIEDIREIEPVKLLYELIIKKSVDVDKVKQYLQRTDVMETGELL